MAVVANQIVQIFAGYGAAVLLIVYNDKQVGKYHMALFLEFMHRVHHYVVGTKDRLVFVRLVILSTCYLKVTAADACL